MVFSFYRAHLNNKGMSLISAVVAMGLAGILILIMAQIWSNSAQTEQRLFDRMAKRDFKNLLSETLNTSACGIQALSGGLTIPVTDSSWTASTNYNLPTGISSPFLTAIPGASFQNLNVSSVDIRPFHDETTGVDNYIGLDETTPGDITTARTIRGHLVISLTDFKGNPTSPLIFPVNLGLNSTGNAINNCTSLDPSSNILVMCEKFGGTYDTIGATCDLPCPAGFMDSDGVCISVDELTDTAIDSLVHCGPTDSCSVDPTYVF